MLVQTLNQMAKSQFEPDLFNTVCNERHLDPWSQPLQQSIARRFVRTFSWMESALWRSTQQEVDDNIRPVLINTIGSKGDKKYSCIE